MQNNVHSHRSPLRWGWWLLLTMLYTPALWAQYKVEFIVFRDRSEQDRDEERWAPDPGQPPIESAVRLGSDRIREAEPNGLTGVARALQSSGEFEPVAHMAYVQPVYSRSNAPHVYVSAAGGAIDGTIKLASARFLHMEVDLRYRPGSFSNSGGLPNVVRIRGKRRMRPGELHLIDHPLGGVLVRVGR